MKSYRNTYNIVLAGNPNVGKSTVFNNLTGLRNHTGNWAGKTVDCSQGEYVFKSNRYFVQDLPGTYSLTPNSAEEAAACEYIISGSYDILVIVLDSTCIERNIKFAVQILSSVKSKCIICLNLIDEAEKKGITINSEKMSELLGVPVISTAARSGIGINNLKLKIDNLLADKEKSEKCVKPTSDNANLSETVFNECCQTKEKSSDSFDRSIDKYLISKTFGIPLMLILFLLIFWITIIGANYPSEWLSKIFEAIGKKLNDFLIYVKCPEIISSALTDGVYRTLTWIIAVMLPPMAIFFPLFTLLEDSGYLPRIAFNMDSAFEKAGTHGKQSLTMAMGFGCNACGVTGCRIIDSPRERLIAVTTNSLVPCNGRFPMLIAIISMFMIGTNGGGSSALKAVVLTGAVCFSIAVTLLMSKILSKTVLKGVPSSFVLELPPYRRPQFGKVIIRSIFDRTLFVLFRAIVIAAPAGLLIWILANVKIEDISLLSRFTEILDPFGVILGLNGAILAGFILGFPANEIVLPIILMIYLSSGTLEQLPDLMQMREILLQNGWTMTTAICTLIFAMFHFPCSTTLITIYKETKSIKWTLFSFFMPLTVGVTVCLVIRAVSELLMFF